MPVRRFAKGTYDAYFKRGAVRAATASRKKYRSKLKTGSMRNARSWASRSLNTHRFTRYAGTSPSIVTMGDGASSFFSNNHVFTLQSVVNAGEFLALFDQYKIEKVVVTYRLVTNPDAGTYLNTTAASATNFYPQVWSIPDYDDNTGLNISEMKERIGVKCRILRPNSKLTYVVRPKVLVQTYRTAVTTGYAPKAMFVDMTTQDIPHYGLKTVIDFQGIIPSVAQPFKMVQEFRYFFTCKNVR